jgi:hypothetical protein
MCFVLRFIRLCVTVKAYNHFFLGGGGEGECAFCFSFKYSISLCIIILSTIEIKCQSITTVL